MVTSELKRRNFRILPRTWEFRRGSSPGFSQNLEGGAPLKTPGRAAKNPPWAKTNGREPTGGENQKGPGPLGNKGWGFPPGRNSLWEFPQGGKGPQICGLPQNLSGGPRGVKNPRGDFFGKKPLEIAGGILRLAPLPEKKGASIRGVFKVLHSGGIFPPRGVLSLYWAGVKNSFKSFAASNGFCTQRFLFVVHHRRLV